MDLNDFECMIALDRIPLGNTHWKWLQVGIFAGILWKLTRNIMANTWRD